MVVRYDWGSKYTSHIKIIPNQKACGSKNTKTRGSQFKCKNNILNPSINRNAAIPCELRGSRRNLKTVFDLFEIWASCFNCGLP